MKLLDALMHVLNGDDVIHEDLGDGHATRKVEGRFDLLPRHGWKLVTEPKKEKLFDKIKPVPNLRD